MKRKKFMILNLLLSAVIVASIFTLLFNAIVYKYIDTEAKKSILEEMTYEYDHQNFASEGYEHLLFRPTVYVIEKDVPSLFSHDDWLINVYNNHKESIYDKVLIHNKEDSKYYIKAMRLNDEIMIFYVNVSGMLRFISTVNVVFIISIFIIGLVLASIGYHLGKKLDESEEKVKVFYQNVSHDLKTPLMVIEGYAESIENELVDYKEAASIIGQESNKMTQLINELLDLSKFESGNKKLNLTKTYLGELLLETLDRTSFLIEEKKLHVTLDVEDTIIMCDGDLIERVFLNLLSNAVKHAEKELFVACHLIGHQAVVTIGNDGQTLSEEEQSTIFNRFYSKGNLSSGIGLSLSQEIIEKHKGSIDVISDHDTRFTITLPQKP